MAHASGWYRGWTMVGIGIAMVMLSVGSVLYGYGIYVTPVARELGLSRQTMNAGIVCQQVGTACLTPLIGRALDRMKVSTIVAISAIALGGGLIGLGIGDALGPKAAILLVPISFGFSGAGSIASYVLVARWFQVHRARAMAIVALGQSGGGVIFAPVLGIVVATIGWRQAIVYQGCFVAAALLLIAWVIVDAPGPGEHEPSGASPAVADATSEVARIGHPLPLGTILSSPAFWVLAGLVSLTLAVIQGTIISLVPLATGRGITLVRASTLLSVLGLSDIAGKIALGAIADRVDRRTLVILGVAIILAFTLSLTVDLGYAGLAVSCALAGVAVGGFFPVYSALLADRFGSQSLGSTEGLVSPAISLTSAAAIYLAGSTFDATCTYRVTFLLFSAALAVALVLAVAFRAMGPPAPRGVPA